MSLVSWQPHVSPLVLLALVALATAWVFLLRRRMMPRWGAGLWWLLLPKLVVATLLVLALLDPTLQLSSRGPSRSVLLLVDQSSSMEVVDPLVGGAANSRSRRERAEACVRDIHPPGGLTLTTRYFDSSVHEQPAAPTAANAPGAQLGTDIAACLQEAARSTAAGSCAGIVLISDGGDEPVSADGLPGVPISAIGVGSDMAGATNCAIVDCSAPATAERGVAFTITVDAQAVGGEDFLAHCHDVELRLERRAARAQQEWSALDSKRLDLSHGRGRAEFLVTPSELGPAHYRVTLAGQPGEVSLLDNARTSLVDVRERSLHVLYYSRSLGLGYKPLRAELSRDSGIGFTALFQTIGGRLAQRTGERFTVQGERGASDDGLEAGFPASAAVLAHYDCIILGSFPASAWSEAQAHALLDYVSAGGAVVFLGGEESFGRGGYASSSLAALMPWQIRDGEPAMSRGEVALMIPASAQGHAITQGLGEGFARGARVASVNQVGALRGGADAIIEAVVEGSTLAVVAVQPYGKGKIMGIASDTLWRLNDSALGSTFGIFWRQAVRFLADRGEGGQVLRVVWDKASYRPGDSAQATVRLTASGGTCRLTAALDGPDGHADLAPASMPATAGACWSLNVPFAHRGDYALRIVAYRDDAALETYEKVIEVAPSLPEGARLSCDQDGLTQLAQSHGGIYAPEADTRALAPWLDTISRAQSQVQSRSLIFSGPWWLVLVACGLLWEWILRRRRNLI